MNTHCSARELNEIPRSERLWVFGNGHGARIIWHWASQHLDHSLSGFVCENGHTLSELPSIPEDSIQPNDHVLVASQYADIIKQRLQAKGIQYIYDVSDQLKQILLLSRKALSFKRAFHESTPFSLSLYKTLLETLRRTSEYTPYAKQVFNSVNSRSFHRYDIDTERCRLNMPMMLDIALEVGVIPTVFIRTDGLDFSPDNMVKDVEKYSALGVEFGLHTSCYALPEAHQALEFELERFRQLFGIEEPGLTVHGLGAQFSQQRQTMGEFIAANAESLGLAYADIPSHFRHHHYVIQDCHLDSETGQRYLLDDVEHIALIAKQHIDILLLIHPCYWG